MVLVGRFELNQCFAFRVCTVGQNMRRVRFQHCAACTVSDMVLEKSWFTIIIAVGGYYHHLSLNREGCLGTTDDFTISFLHFSLFSTALWDLPNSRPVHSLMLPCHLFLCLLCLLPPFTVPCKMVLARPDEWKTCPFHFSLRLFMMASQLLMVRRSSCGLIALWILAHW